MERKKTPKTQKKGKIVLFQPKASEFFAIESPNAILAVSRPLVAEGYEVKLISECLYPDYLTEVLKSCDGAICLGISCITGYQIANGIKIANAIKKQYPKLPIVWGGWHPSLTPMQTIKDPCVDIVVRGQGELTFQEVVHKLENNQQLDNVKGITYKKNGRVYHNEDRPIENVANFPPFPFHIMDVEKCIEPNEFGTRSFTYISSQGCPHRCQFCADPVVYKRRWSGLTAEQMIRDVNYLVKKHNINVMIFSDTNFFVDKERIRKFCKLLLKKRLKIAWGLVDGRTRQLLRYDDNLWKLMKKCGLRNILIGAEAGSQELLDILKKDTTIEDTVELTKKCNRYGIQIIYSMMVGIPRDSFKNSSHNKIKKEIRAEIESVLNLVRTVNGLSKNLKIRHRYYLFVYTPYPGTPLYEKSKELGFKEPKTLKGWSEFTFDKKNTPWFPEEYTAFVEQLMNYYFIFLKFDKRYVEKEYFKKENITKSYGSIVYYSVKLYFEIFATIARLRWRCRFFAFPLDYYIFKKSVEILRIVGKFLKSSD